MVITVKKIIDKKYKYKINRVVSEYFIRKS